jgi:NAD(P)-dependent dehydrogenase (short-subunit alcohol dehydrogenase family)
MKVAITGANDGIGKETARQLLEKGHQVVMISRDSTKSENALADLRKSGTVDLMHCDLASLSEVARAAEKLQEDHPETQVIICNAGVMSKRRKESRDGLELNFAVNHLAHFLLVTRILDMLQKNAPSRIVVVSSMVHESGRVDLSNLQMESGYDGMSAYAQSKRANVLFVHELARRLEGTGVTANALHPGVIATKLLHEYFSGGAPVSDGAKTSVYLATSQEIGSVTGQYFKNSRPASSSALEGDGETARLLWERSEELINEILPNPGKE